MIEPALLYMFRHKIIGEKRLLLSKGLSKLLAEYLLSLINVKQIKISSLLFHVKQS